jgi:hypothetical protein
MFAASPEIKLDADFSNKLLTRMGHLLPQPFSMRD